MRFQNRPKASETPREWTVSPSFFGVRGIPPTSTGQIPTCRSPNSPPATQARRSTCQTLRWRWSPALGIPGRRQRWRLAYRRGGSQKLLAVGVYPEVGLKDAREAREAAKRVLARGGDPMAVKKQAKAEQATASVNTFEAIAAELVAKKRSEDKADQTISKTEWLLSLAHPETGARPIKEITAPDILRVLRAVALRGRFESAKRLRATIGQVFRYAVAT